MQESGTRRTRSGATPTCRRCRWCRRDSSVEHIRRPCLVLTHRRLWPPRLSRASLSTARRSFRHSCERGAITARHTPLASFASSASFAPSADRHRREGLKLVTNRDDWRRFPAGCGKLERNSTTKRQSRTSALNCIRRDSLRRRVDSAVVRCTPLAKGCPLPLLRAARANRATAIVPTTVRHWPQ